MNRIDAFIRERQYLHNVSPNTVSWYRHALRWLPSEDPTPAELKEVVLKMRQQGLKETGCNAAIRAINAFLHWSSDTERKCGPGCSHPRMRPLKEPDNLLPTFSEGQVKLIVGWKPRQKNLLERRWHLLSLLLLDLGCRISEALTLRVGDLDLDNLLCTVSGKGRKERIIPFSYALRKALHRYIVDFGLKPDALLFSTRAGTPVRRITALRSIKRLCRHLGFEPPARTLHAFRHTFAQNYVRHGGSVFHLQKTLGHRSLEMSRRYANLVVADLQAVHERVSLLSR
jgi:integrase/recombinase XerD